MEATDDDEMTNFPPPITTGDNEELDSESEGDDTPKTPEFNLKKTPDVQFEVSSSPSFTYNEQMAGTSRVGMSATENAP